MMTETPDSLARARYRVQQFVRGLTARVTDEERAVADSWLPPAARTLFRRMPQDAQRHSLNVLAALLEQVTIDPDLAAAALLHDVGKVAAADAGVAINLWLRGPLVLLDAFAPGTAARAARPDTTGGWRYALYVHREHPTIGADWAAVAGCSELTCWLIRHHQDNHAQPAETRHGELLAALQWADSRY